MLKEFCFNGLKIKLHPEVYEPSEDTFQLLEVIKVKQKTSILEIGTGSGLISLECARKGANVVSTDINPFAIELLNENYKNNKQKILGKITTRLGYLFKVINKNEFFDIIVFNPPYLPTKKEERVGGWFDVATDGGKDGLKLTKKYIKEYADYLKRDGFAYFVFSSLSDRKKLESSLKKKCSKYEIISNKRYNDEIISIYKLFP